MEQAAPNKRNAQKRTLLRLMALTAFALFICIQFYSIYFRWYNHQGPLGLGDSLYYIANIAYFKDHSLFSKSEQFQIIDTFLARFSTDDRDAWECVKWYYMFNGCTSTYLLGVLARITNVSAENIFHYNFYIGIFIVGAVLFIVLRQQGVWPLNVVIGLLMFALYTGEGSYHGFEWVTPSFYSVVFWLLNIAIFFYSRRWKLLAPLSVLLLVFSHTLSLYCLPILVAALGTYGVLSGEVYASLKKAAYLSMLFVLYFIVYKILHAKDIILPLFLDNYGFDNMWTFDFQGMKNVICYTDFRVYFSGWLLPLTVGSLVYCVVRKEYALLSLFVTAFLGTMTFSALHLRGIRTFLYLEIALMLVFCYGIQQSLLFLWNCRTKARGIAVSFAIAFISGFIIFRMLQVIQTKVSLPFLWQFIAFLFLVIYGIFQVVWGKKDKNSLSRLSAALAANGVMLIFALALLHLNYCKLMSNDFIRKFYHPRFCQITELEAYLNARENPGMLFNLGSTFHSLTLVALEGGWDNTIYVPCMLGPDTPVDFLKQFTFVAYNYRLYESERSGLGASWPHGSSIVLRTGELAPGRYRLSLSDTGLPDDDFSAIALDVGSGGSAAGGWEHEEMSVMYPLENAYPAVMPPWYARLARKQGPVEVRKARKHVLEFSIAETSDRLRLRNQGEDLIFMGSVELVETISGTIVAGVDFDWGTADEINMKTALLLEDREVPLLWKDSAFDIRVRVTAGGSAPLALKLEENFNDVKVLSLCDEFYASGFQQRTALTF